MKKFFLFLFLFNLFAFPVFASKFMSSFEDIPLQDGFVEHESLNFDTEDVRVVEEYISSEKVSKAEFIKFYTDTLKSLGWKLETSTDTLLKFNRDDETLTINIETISPLVALFTLKPIEKKSSAIR